MLLTLLVINGGDGDDVIIGSGGRDTINGSTGNDILFGDNAYHQFIGTQLHFANSTDYYSGTSISYADTISGDQDDDIIVGGNDADSMYPSSCLLVIILYSLTCKDMVQM